MSNPIARLAFLLGSTATFGMAVACGSAPNGTEGETWSSSHEALSVTCGDVFTKSTCVSVCTGSLPSKGGGNLQTVSCVPSCTCETVATPVTSTLVTCTNDAGAYTPAPVPSVLAALGCTSGVSFPGETSTNSGVWACPATITVPDTIGIAPPCNPNTVGGGDTPQQLDGGSAPFCELVRPGNQDWVGQCAGDVAPGWMLVWDFVMATTYAEGDAPGDVNHGCSGQCT